MISRNYDQNNNFFEFLLRNFVIRTNISIIIILENGIWNLCVQLSSRFIRNCCYEIIFDLISNDNSSPVISDKFSKILHSLQQPKRSLANRAFWNFGRSTSVATCTQGRKSRISSASSSKSGSTVTRTWK